MKPTIYDDTLIVKLSKKMKQDIQRKAQKESKTSSEYIRGLVLEDLKWEE